MRSFYRTGASPDLCNKATWDGNGRQNADDGNYHHQFYQREACLHPFSHFE